MSQFYLELPPIRLAIERLKNPPENKHYEHLVGTVSCSLLQFYYPLSENWSITPEQIQHYELSEYIKQQAKSLKIKSPAYRPDFVVEQVSIFSELKPKIFMEIKKVQSSIFKEAMEQVADAMVAQADKQDTSFSFFAIVQSGLEIAFFEYYNYRDVLDEDEVAHYKGLIPLTQEVPLAVKQKESKELVEIIRALPRTLKDTPEHKVPYIFNLEQHAEHIDKMFKYMKNNKQREHTVSIYIFSVNLSLLLTFY